MLINANIRMKVKIIVECKNVIFSTQRHYVLFIGPIKHHQA